MKAEDKFTEKGSGKNQPPSTSNHDQIPPGGETLPQVGDQRCKKKRNLVKHNQGEAPRDHRVIKKPFDEQNVPAQDKANPRVNGPNPNGFQTRGHPVPNQNQWGHSSLVPEHNRVALVPRE